MIAAVKPPGGKMPVLDRDAMRVWVSLSPSERWMLDLMRRRKSDKQIRDVMKLGMRDAFEIANSLRANLGCKLGERIIDRANALGIWYNEEYPA